MLDLSVLVQKLTQGQPQAALTTLAVPPAEAPAAEAQPPIAGEASALPQAAPASAVDARQVAERVYELMRNDLQILLDRRGRW